MGATPEKDLIHESGVAAIVGERLTLEAFSQLAGQLAGYSFVKVVVDTRQKKTHFLNHARYPFHSDYIAEHLLGVPPSQIDQDIDSFNESVYIDPSRRFYLGVLALHKRDDRRFFSLETVEVDTMGVDMAIDFLRSVAANLDPAIPVLFKPANHLQETYVAHADPMALPRVFAHELFATASYIPLNCGNSRGRLRVFESEENYKENRASIEWHDIIAMKKVPDSIPRVLGIVNAEHTTPLSHTNVLASGWQIPNCIQLGILDEIKNQGLNNEWVELSVLANADKVSIRKIERPKSADKPPAWSTHKVKIESPETTNTPILPLRALRMDDRYKYGTKAANLGELNHVLGDGSERLLGFYRIKRPPRPNLLPHLSKLLGVHENSGLDRAANEFLKSTIEVPNGIAIPFSVQQEFLQSSPRIQQEIGKLKMALELNARQIDSIAVTLQDLVNSTRMPEKIRRYIDAEIAKELSGVSSFVVRSSSNAEDLENFSAAGIYESVNKMTTSNNIFDAIKQVWASLLSARSVRLRQEAGISLDDCYMGVIIQEEVKSRMGGVLVTTNPMNRTDFRNVYLNVSAKSVVHIVQGADLPFQYLFNVVEGSGRTLSLGDGKEDLPEKDRATLQKIALAGRLLQSHFAPDYTYATPADVEWILSGDQIYFLQLRPYGN